MGNTNQQFELLAIKQDLAEFRQENNELFLAIKQDLDRMATKDDLQGVKDDLQGVKDDLQGVKDDLQGVKKDLHRFATKDDLLAFATKDDMEHFRDELKEEIHQTFDVLITGQDKIVKILMDQKAENAANQSAHGRFQTTLDTHERRIGVLENPV
ncbi:hypothetical protein HY933_04675 [Candidatus Falkowbacteria bacterium]|nr:hypothetical protein [Candidatus Falkowbacteria bacterium]